jgi:hypothetical protein
MFDPSIFDNLKVVVEGELYDLERDGAIQIANRQDLLDLAGMSRTFSMCFHLPGCAGNQAELRLYSELRDFAFELANLRITDFRPGCALQLVYRLEDWQPDESQLRSLQQLIYTLWKDEISLRQQLVIPYSSDGSQDEKWVTRYEAILTYKQKVDESHITQIRPFLEHAIEALNHLQTFIHSTTK